MPEHLTIVTRPVESREAIWSPVACRELILEPRTGDPIAGLSWAMVLEIMPPDLAIELRFGSAAQAHVDAQMVLLAAGGSSGSHPAERILALLAEELAPSAALGRDVDPIATTSLNPVLPSGLHWLPARRNGELHREPQRRDRSLWFSPPSAWPWNMNRATHILSSGSRSADLVLRLEPVAQATMAADAFEALEARIFAERSKGWAGPWLDLVARDARALAQAERLCRLSMFVDATGPDQFEDSLLALSLFGTKAGPAAAGAVHDLRGLIAPGAAPRALLTLTRKSFAFAPRTSNRDDPGRLAVGRLPAGDAVAISGRDRLRHTYVLGATGTGKSTLLRRMIAQDAQLSGSLILLDPHGDLVHEVAQDLRGHDRLRVADAGAPDGGFALDLLSLIRDPGTREQGFDIFNEVFQRLLYQRVDAFGPMFDQYFRNALTLLATGSEGDLELHDLPRIFTDRELRGKLLQRADDPQLSLFWRKVAPSTTGDYALDNFTPYITSKLTRFVGSPAGQRIFRAARGLDFSAALDAGEVLLLRIPKGELGPGLAELAAAVALQQIARAVMARPVGRRTPLRLYVDEMQSCPGSSLAMLLAEGRKFGVSLTLANQSLGQVGGGPASLANAVLANVGNLLLFRLGAPDAALLAPWLAEPDSWRSLCRIPDFHFTARILANGRPMVVPLAQALPPDSAPTALDG